MPLTPARYPRLLYQVLYRRGHWDLVGNNTPIFYLRDPLKFPDLNHVVKRDPRTNLRNPTWKWDFFSLLPETLHQLTIDFSDRGIPRSYRHMRFRQPRSALSTLKMNVLGEIPLQIPAGIANLMDDEETPGGRRSREFAARSL